MKNYNNKNEYQKEYQLKRYHKRRQYAFEKLGGKCYVCGTTKDLEIDHIKAEEKEIPLNRLWGVSQERFDNELKKCQLLCHEHHKIKTKVNREHVGGHNRVDDYDHGSGHMYYKEKCRCEKCLQWRRLYRTKQVTYRGETN